MKIAIIGAGASGIFAALEAARKRSHKIVLIEKNPSIGRKILVTGSGRCNLSNDAVSFRSYTCASQAWAEQCLSNFRVAELLTLLSQYGIPTKKTDDGWYYPLSESAHSVVDILKENLIARKVELRVATKALELSRKDGKNFSLKLEKDGEIYKDLFDAVVIACGGAAYPTLGSDGNFFEAIKKMGHTVLPLQPALGPIYAQLGSFKALQGVRFDAHAAILLKEGQLLGETYGNIIVTEKGFNGPGAMNLSHLVSTHPNEELELCLDLAKPVQAAFEDGLATSMLSARAFLLGFFPPKLADAFLEMGELKPNLRIEDLTLRQWERLVRTLSNQTFAVTGTGNAMVSQVSIGGVPVTEVSAETLESVKVPGLYLVGETLDLVGPCGGFNLHFAFASGAKAGWALAAR